MRKQHKEQQQKKKKKRRLEYLMYKRRQYLHHHIIHICSLYASFLFMISHIPCFIPGIHGSIPMQNLALPMQMRS